MRRSPGGWFSAKPSRRWRHDRPATAATEDDAAGAGAEIAPQDAYKSPVDLSLALRGAFDDTPAVGYNTFFVYPQGGLDLLARRMAERCRVEFDRRVTRIDLDDRAIIFADGSARRYQMLLSTLPLNRVMEMAGLSTVARADPFTSVLVLNIGATKGDACPDDHWLYVPHSEAGFHRVGFYSNVDPSFLPAAARRAGDRVSIYVERSFPGGARPPDAVIEEYSGKTVDELREWGFIEQAEVVHPTWIDVAYTWSWPGSSWKSEALRLLQDNGIYQVGRYGRWLFQGIAELDQGRLRGREQLPVLGRPVSRTYICLAPRCPDGRTRCAAVPRK